MTDPLASTLAEASRAGVYRFAGDASAIARAAQAAGLACFRVDLGQACAKADFLDRVSESMRFPDWFGHNWDALADCLGDLSWVVGAGYVVLLEKSRAFGESRPREFAEAMNLMAEAARFWRDQGKPFWVLVEEEALWDPGLPPLSGA